MYIDDLVYAVMKACKTPVAGVKLVNVGTGVGTSIRTLAQMLAELPTMARLVSLWIPGMTASGVIGTGPASRPCRQRNLIWNKQETAGRRLSLQKSYPPAYPHQCALAWSACWRTLLDSKKAVSPMRGLDVKKPAEAG